MSEQSNIDLLNADDAFASLQKRFTAHFYEIFLNDLAEKTVVIIPSLTLDREILRTVRGAVFYEERLLCMLLLLRMPRTRLVYVTSVPIDSQIIDYYLHLLPGISEYHARERLTLLSCYDSSETALTKKILDRPRLINRIREHIRVPEMTHMACFNVTELEKQLALELDIPIFGCDPALLHLGTKSGGRRLFRKIGLPVPEGIEDLANEQDIAMALTQLKRNNPSLEKAVVKMNDGFSGEGNGVFYYFALKAEDEKLQEQIADKLPRHMKIVASNLTYSQFMDKFTSMGGIVEEFIPGEIKESPSVQCRINPLGDSDVISTHDQLLGGESGQVFLGSSFPANPEYSRDISIMARVLCDEMQKEGVLGRFSVDFISVKQPEGWKHYAIEINLRKGGTTHPFIMLQYLTSGIFDWQRGEYVMPNGQTRCYFASDNVVSEKYKGLTPYDLIDIAMCNHIQFDGALQTGVMFHMIGALSQYGKLGLVCIGRTPEEAKGFFEKTIEVLEKESA
ncbi:MAG: carboxylate-amine ligase [Chitinophagaceae bacterium]|nr:carboxylate-amine ligase [Chitinophagaceae bacterium]